MAGRWLGRRLLAVPPRSVASSTISSPVASSASVLRSDEVISHLRSSMYPRPGVAAESTQDARLWLLIVLACTPHLYRCRCSAQVASTASASTMHAPVGHCLRDTRKRTRNYTHMRARAPRLQRQLPVALVTSSMPSSRTDYNFVQKNLTIATLRHVHSVHSVPENGI